MKIFKILFVALVAMIGFNSCSEDCDHVLTEHDHSADLVGTWTCFQKGFAEALVIKADGSALSTGYDGEEFWENVAGNIVVENGKIVLTFEDGDNWKGHFDIVPGVAFSIFTDKGDFLTFNYCKEDLSEEIVGMWVCTQTNLPETNMTIQTYQEDGKSIFTGFSPNSDSFMTNLESTYNVVGDLMFQKTGDMYFVTRLAYVPNGTSFGDILNTTAKIWVNDAYVTSSYSFLRIKQGLNLTNKLYAYSSAYVSNAKGADEDFNITGNTFNMAHIKAGNFDMMFRSVLFCMNLNANSITQRFLTNGVDTSFDTPITVEGNKVTLDMSASNPAYRNIEMYMFQDADDSQLHIYMPTQSFINYFANLEVVTLLTEGKIDPTDAAAVAKVYADMEARVESINVSFVMKAIEEIK